jgi:hypothetical protein
MNRTTNAESSGAFLLVCDLPSAIAAKSVAAFPKAAVLRVSCNESRSFPPKFSNYFPASFSDSFSA